VLRYAIDFAGLDRVLGQFSRVFDVRVTFFDADGQELRGLGVKAMSAFCRHHRKSPAFDERCIACDRKNIDQARATGGTRVYLCHAGLIEAVVPLRDERGSHLGALLFGQLRPQNGRGRGLSSASRRLYFALPPSTQREAGDVADLLRYTSEHIIRLQLVRRVDSGWAERLDRYLDEHMGERLTLASLARAIHVSPSFLSHRALRDLGRSPVRYVMERRLQRALERMRAGARVRDVATDLGFCDEFHLSRRFKRRFGCPPTRYAEVLDVPSCPQKAAPRTSTSCSKGARRPNLAGRRARGPQPRDPAQAPGRRTRLSLRGK
jgi:AraC-like DNA-binding protein/ligand-binding sensor protein